MSSDDARQKNETELNEASEEAKEPKWFNELKKLAKPKWIEYLSSPEGGAALSEILPGELEAGKVATDGTDERRIWELIGLFFRAQGRWHDALAIYRSMYTHFLNEQLITTKRIHKGMPLVWIADCYLEIANLPLSKRYMMLTLIEDAISMNGRVDPVRTGSYFRLAWRHGMPDFELKRYSQKAWEVFQEDTEFAMFPEYVLQEMDKSWIIEIPSPNDMSLYIANSVYIEYLKNQLGEGSGKILERLSDYLLSCIPGCRTAMRTRSYSTDYDIVCSLHGPFVDYRSDFGRYFICECKDWSKPADFTTMAKFARVLDSIKANFGIIFSKHGISGDATTEYASREQLKVFQDRGLVIVVIDENDIEYISSSGNFVTLLREKYEEIRLDLRK